MAGIFDEITGQKNAELKADQHSDHKDKALDANTVQKEEVDARTDKSLRDASQDLLRFGFIEENQKPNLYRVSLMNMSGLNAVLEPLDLFARADEIRGLIYLKVRENDNLEDVDNWTHPLVRKQRMTLEQSLLIAILRQYFIAYEQEAGTGASHAIVAVDELIPQLQVYLGDTGSEAKERNRILQLLDQLKGHGLVSTLDSHERVTIRPMIAHLANPENLQALLASLQEQASERIQPND